MATDNLIPISGASAIIAGGILLYFLKKIKSKLRINILRSGGKFEDKD